MTAAELSRKSGIRASSISDYLTGKYEPKQDKIDQLAQALNVSPAWLMGYEHKDSIWNDNVGPTRFNCDFIEIPVLGAVPAGVPVEAIENIIDSIKVSTDFINPDAEHFALRVKGDSMYPKYLEGDTIIVEVRHDCESGQDAIVYVNGYDATLKTVIKNDDGTITLKPHNPEWPSKTYGPDDEPIQILGPVVQQIRTP